MHELSIALSIVSLAEEEAQQQEGRVTAVHLRLGCLSGVVREALLSAFGLAREGTSLAQSELRIEDVPLVVHCPVCSADRPLPSPQERLCPVCGGPTPEVVHGQELEIVALEIET